MKNCQLTTVFYRYNRFAPVIIVLYVVVFLAFFFISVGLPNYVTLIGFAALILPPILSAISKKSFFNLRTWDERRLVLDPEFIKVGEVEYTVKELKIALHIYGFEGFRYNKFNKWITQNTIYGDRNYISFKQGKKVEDYQFFLKDYKALETLWNVVEAWKSAGVTLVVKEEFSRQFVRNEIQRLIDLNKK